MKITFERKLITYKYTHKLKLRNLIKYCEVTMLMMHTDCKMHQASDIWHKTGVYLSEQNARNL